MTIEDGFPSNETDQLWDDLYKCRSKPQRPLAVLPPSTEDFFVG